jgi:ferredoxin
VDRVPHPEFDSGYRPPSTSVPFDGSTAGERVNVAVLAAALGLAAFLVSRYRSRRALVVLSLGSLVYFGFLRQGCPCPIGSIQNVARALGDRSAAVPFVVAATFALPLLFAVWRGRVFCAAVCPAGALQDLVLLHPLRVPAGLAAALSLGRHLYLGLAVLLAATGGAFLVCSWDPFVPLFRLSGGALGFGLLGSFLGASTVVARPYCRFLCPYGVLLGWCARLAGRRAHPCPHECLTCHLCADACPIGALRAPAHEDAPEGRRLAVRRLAWLLALCPALVLAGAWLGSRLDIVLARLHPTVALAERVAAEDGGVVSGTTLESRTFRAGGRATGELMAAAREVRIRVRLGGWILGAYLGLVVSAALLRWSRWPRRASYGPDAGDCLACGRCFSACPQSRAPLPRLQESSVHV